MRRNNKHETVSYVSTSIDNKKAGLVKNECPRMGVPSRAGIHAKDDTLLFPTYSNILFFIALPRRGEKPRHA